MFQGLHFTSNNLKNLSGRSQEKKKIIPFLPISLFFLIALRWFSFVLDLCVQYDECLFSSSQSRVTWADSFITSRKWFRLNSSLRSLCVCRVLSSPYWHYKMKLYIGEENRCVLWWVVPKYCVVSIQICCFFSLFFFRFLFIFVYSSLRSFNFRFIFYYYSLIFV